MINKAFQIQLKTEFFEEDGAIVGVAPELNVSSFGYNLTEAKPSLKEAVEGFLETCRNMHTLEEVPEESGFTPQQDKRVWQPRQLVKQEQLDFFINPALACA